MTPNPRLQGTVKQRRLAVGQGFATWDVQYINATYRRTGTLWDGRYKCSLIQAETYLYLVRPPLR